MKLLETIGKYFLMLRQVFTKPQKPKIFWENYFKEIEDLGIKSIGLISFISFFIGYYSGKRTAILRIKQSLHNDSILKKD